MNTSRLEQAQALGFKTVEELEDHQQRLDELNQHRQKAWDLVAASNGELIIDLMILDRAN